MNEIDRSAECGVLEHSWYSKGMTLIILILKCLLWQWDTLCSVLN
jgi:hypothetical protein